MTTRQRRKHRHSLRHLIGALVLTAGVLLVMSGLPPWFARVLVGLSVLFSGWLLIKDGR